MKTTECIKDEGMMGVDNEVVGSSEGYLEINNYIGEFVDTSFLSHYLKTKSPYK